jgi:hypothetical protein
MLFSALHQSACVAGRLPVTITSVKCTERKTGLGKKVRNQSIKLAANENLFEMKQNRYNSIQYQNVSLRNQEKGTYI